MTSTKAQAIVDQMVALETSANLVQFMINLDVSSDMWGHGSLDAGRVCIFGGWMCQVQESLKHYHKDLLEY